MSRTKHINQGKMDMQAAAQEIGVKGGRNGLFKLLRQHGHFKKCNNCNLPSRQLVIDGLFHVEPTSATTANGIRREYIKVWVTGAGLVWLAEFAERHKALKSTAA